MQSKRENNIAVIKWTKGILGIILWSMTQRFRECETHRGNIRVSMLYLAMHIFTTKNNIIEEESNHSDVLHREQKVSWNQSLLTVFYLFKNLHNSEDCKKVSCGICA